MRRQRGVVDPNLLGIMMVLVLGAAIWTAVSWDSGPTDAEIRAVEMEALGMTACTDNALPKDYVTTLAMRTWVAQEAKPEPVQETEPEPVATEAPNANPMDKLAIAWLVAKTKKPLMGFGAAVGLFLLFRFFRGTHLLCWFKHKGKYGDEVWQDEIYEKRFYVLWACGRCGKSKRKYLPPGIWKIHEGRLYRDTDAFLRGDRQPYCVINNENKKKLVDPNKA